jgi:hypothetical protein
MDWVNIHSAWNDVIHGPNQAQTFQTPTRGYAETFVGRHDYISPRGPEVDYDYHQIGDTDKENRQYMPYLESNVKQARGRISGGKPNGGRVRHELRNTLHGAREVIKELENKSRRKDFFFVLGCFKY